MSSKVCPRDWGIFWETGRLPCSAFSLQVIVQWRRVLLLLLPLIIFIQLPLMLLLRDEECQGWISAHHLSPVL